MPPIMTGDPVTWSVYMSVCMSVTLVHSVKAVGRNEMPFGRDTVVVQTNIVLDSAPPYEKGRIGRSELQFAASYIGPCCFF